MNNNKESNNIQAFPTSVPKKREGKGRGVAKKYDDAVEGTIEEKKEIAKQVGQNVMVFYQMGMERVKTTTELQERIIQFFNTCIETGQFPSVEKMCLAIGYDRKTVWSWETERRTSQLVQDSPLPVVDIIKKAKEFLASYDAEMAMSGKLNPVLYIFRGKNYYQLQDKQELTIEPKQALGEQKSMEEIAASVPELLDSDIIDE